LNIITPGGNGTPDARGIGKAARPAPTPADKRAGQARTADTSSSLELSARGERFVSLRAKLDTLDASRGDRVERLRKLVASGQYKVSGQDIADAMLNDPATADALGMR
jgi:negative regulator of flagellin synthesis FlgM